MTIWTTLDIPSTRDTTAIRRAYAARLKVTHPEDDAEGFIALRTAYEAAIDLAREAAPPSPGPQGVSPPEISEPDKPAPAMSRAATPARRPPSYWSLTIDQMLDEAVLDERREPELQSLMHALTQVLGSDKAGDQDRVAAFDRVLRSSAMESSRLYDRTEAWTSGLLKKSDPATDSLLELAIDFFGWDNAPTGDAQPHGAEALNRVAAFARLRRLRDHAHHWHDAFVALRDPPWGGLKIRYRLSFGLGARVRDLLASIEGDRAMEAALDPVALGWWRNRLSRPFLPAAAYWAILLGPLLVAGAAEYGDPYTSELLVFWVVWTMCAMAGALVLVIWRSIIWMLNPTVRSSPSYADRWAD